MMVSGVTKSEHLGRCELSNSDCCLGKIKKQIFSGDIGSNLNFIFEVFNVKYDLESQRNALCTIALHKLLFYTHTS